ncbi:MULTISPECIES: hypothetical protein [unclassified Xanthobacter]|uniref:hypothetical protein n=1 Tax=unclassified Xanthobacter TaxID=2623496 RepID=UPI001F299751|nr:MULTISPECIES: hypothetical protein [unclassified Xanthobacter]
MGSIRLNTFLEALKAAEPAGPLVNPYRGWVKGIDADPEAPAARARHLQAYLGERLSDAALILVAEAPGYQGARFSGIAMTCERTLLGHKPQVPASAVMQMRAVRTSDPAAARNDPERLSGFGEPTATMVWGEVSAHLDLLEALLDLFPGRPVVAVGETAKRNLARLGIEAAGVRHPANGGCSAFGRGLAANFDQLGFFNVPSDIRDAVTANIRT